MIPIRLSTICMLLLVPLSGAAFAGAGADAEQLNDDTQRVGLVLSGGGARGAAHIGVLKYLEAQRVPVDFVVGTSVGAIIGGLYASGMSASEIEELVLSLDWNEMFSDTGSAAEMDIRRKLQRYRFLVDIDAGIRDGELVFPTGFIRGQRMQLMLREQTLPVRHVTDFDELPTPFRSVATDLATARAVVFDRGDLVQAMRASMSVPGVYSTVRFRDTRLVDGGIVQNFPVPIARELGADRLIAVDVATPLRDVEALDSPFAVTSQVIDGMMLDQSRRMREQMQPDDILIAPQIEGVADVSAFDALEPIIEKGYSDAAGHAEEFSALSVSESAYADYRTRRQARRRPLSHTDRIMVDSEQGVEKLVRARLNQVEGEALDVEQLHNDLDALYGLGLFEVIGYEIQETDDGDEVLVIRAEPRETGPLRFEAGVELQETFSGNTAFQLRAAVNQVGVNSRGGEWRSEIGLGTVTGIATEFHQPLTYSGRFFTAANYTYATGELLIRGEGSDEPGEYRLRENVAGLDVGMKFGQWSTARLGVRFGREDAFVRESSATLFDDRRFDVGDVVFRFHHDSMDSFSFPSSGSRIDVRWERALDELGASDGEYAGVDLLTAFSHERDSLLLGATFESVLDGERFLAQGVALGGVRRLSGFERDELVGEHAGLLRAVYYRYLGQGRDRLINLPLYAGITAEAGNVWQDSDAVSRDDLVYGGSAFVALDTFIGPISLAYGRNSAGKDAFYLSIGTINGPSFRQFRR